MSRTPIILIGRSARIAIKVCDDLLPEYDVIHVILSSEQGVKDLPLLLSTPPRVPEHSRDNIGSQKYDGRARAIVLGGGIDDDMFHDMKNACNHVDNSIFWVRADISVDNMPDLSDTEAFGAETVKRVKRKLNELEVSTEGAAVKSEGVHFF
ncbi:hypothetical protein BDU57DRAFT_518318 [Ampelomyces quisqualis]|uniref:Uncharacterized protein n=1 Tax=Ampelomyces quisqualis TaxID=50730 RepID=A0A6A5QMW8_AMPQU|nr:hypothetical protein BDU57DRAFT_518318 [Ampelomyces quisqualis]